MTAEKVLAIAKAELGTKESPANSNRVKYNTWYYGREVSGSAYPWCMAFVQWVFAQAGVKLPAKTASCGALMNAAKKAGQWVTKDYHLGDVVIYDFPGGAATDHTGIVTGVGRLGVTAIEGNTSQAGSQSNGGMVCRKTRPYNQIVGAVRPNFQKEEDGMTIDKLTDEEVLQLGKRLQVVMGKQAVSPALAPELQEAKAQGITDGSSPGAFCTRAQAAVMTLRATKM
ncbi:CHAP domain-containing protein [uncultured Oscillibacter sp.]|uniref:CHAP domain-containing protein n=1 Tax=uncultured Oscillibacter sp. TaxID=876091 RepID=UPI00260E6068|nr:CHAP domain-containing protein [uncultured Oscillibacter sp.]